MSTNYDFIDALRRRVPEIEPLYREHLHDNDELLPHVLMSDIARFAEEIHARSANGSPRATEVLSRLLGVLEEGMHAEGGNAKELIAVSFVENLNRDYPHFADLKSRFGEGLLRAAEEQRGIYGEE